MPGSGPGVAHDVRDSTDSARSGSLQASAGAVVIYPRDRDVNDVKEAGRERSNVPNW